MRLTFQQRPDIMDGFHLAILQCRICQAANTKMVMTNLVLPGLSANISMLGRVLGQSYSV